MNNATNRALDALAAKDKAAGGTGTDYSLAKMMGVPPNIVSNYRRGVSQMDDERAIRAAELLGVGPLRLISEINMERARTARTKGLWARTLKDHGGKVAGLVLAAVMSAAAGFPAPAQASVRVQVVDLYNARNSRRRSTGAGRRHVARLDALAPS